MSARLASCSLRRQVGLDAVEHKLRMKFSSVDVQNLFRQIRWKVVGDLDKFVWNLVMVVVVVERHVIGS